MAKPCCCPTSLKWKLPCCLLHCIGRALQSLVTMAKSGLLGPYPLTEESLQKHIEHADDWSSASVFALGHVKNQLFYLRRVGHADGDLSDSLRRFIGQYPAFRFKFCRSTRSAYYKECEIYHSFKPQDNVTHPEKPKNTKFTCPVSSCAFGA